MSRQTNVDDAAIRAYQGLTRGTFVTANDQPKMQELTVRARFGEQYTNVEHWHPYGFTSVPLPPSSSSSSSSSGSDSSSDQDQAEVLLAYLGGSPDHPICIATADRRYRPKDLQPGDSAHHDHRGQKTVINKDGMTHTTPFTITHNVVDSNGKVLSSIVQHSDGKKITMTNADGTTVTMDGPNLTHKAGTGGKVTIDGDVNVKGDLSATKTIAGLAVTSGGLPVQTT